MKKKLIIFIALLVMIGLGIGYYLTDGNLLQGRFYTGLKLDVNTSTGTPPSDIVVAGSTDVEVAEFKFASAATGSNWRIEGLVLAVNPNVENNIEDVTIEYEDEDGMTKTDTVYFTSGLAEFVDVDLPVEVASTSYLTVYVDVNTLDGGAIAGDAFAIGIDEFTANNLDNGNMVTRGVQTRANSMQVYETKPTLSLSANSPSGSRTVDADDEPFIFNVSADSGEDVEIQSVMVNITASSDLNSDEVNPVTAYLKQDGAIKARGDVVFLSPSEAYVEIVKDAGITFDVAAGSTEAITLEIDTATLLDEDSGIDDPLTFSIEFGGGFNWFDSNVFVDWLGNTASPTLDSHTLMY